MDQSSDEQCSAVAPLLQAVIVNDIKRHGWVSQNQGMAQSTGNIRGTGNSDTHLSTCQHNFNIHKYQGFYFIRLFLFFSYLS